MISRPILDGPDLSAYREPAAKYGMMGGSHLAVPSVMGRHLAAAPVIWPGDAYYRCRNLLSYGGLKGFDLAHGIRLVAECPAPGYFGAWMPH